MFSLGRRHLSWAQETTSVHSLRERPSKSRGRSMQIRRFPRGAADRESRSALGALPTRGGIEGISVTQDDRPEGEGGGRQKTQKTSLQLFDRQSTSLERRFGGGQSHDHSLERWKDHCLHPDE